MKHMERLWPGFVVFVYVSCRIVVCNVEVYFRFYETKLYKPHSKSTNYTYKWHVNCFMKKATGGETRRLSIAAPSHATPCPAAHKVDLGRRGRPNAQASVGFVPGAKARSAHQSRGLASLVRVTWCFDWSPHGSAGSTGHAEAVVGFTFPKPAGRRCWVATAGDCTDPQTLGLRRR